MALTAIAFLLTFAAGCGMAFVRHPIYGLVTYVAVFYLHPPSRWWGNELPSVRWSLVAALVTLIALILKRGSAPSEPPLFRQGIVIGFLIFLAWIAIQSFWALDPERHSDLVVLSAKYLLLIGLIYKCIETERHLKLFLWAHVAGCFYLGTIVMTDYVSGRFEGFGGPGIEANAAGLQIVTGIFAGAALFLASGWREKAALVGVMPFIVNALVVTISRSGFLALGISGIVFNVFAPRKRKRFVLLASGLGLALFMMLTNSLYWDRISSILIAGEQVEGVDTGAGRLVLIQAQMEMAQAYPLGCGHRCTAVLSPDYLADRYLTGDGAARARSSHNTFMTLYVEQGIPGAMFYALLVFWVVVVTVKLRRETKELDGLLPAVFAATASALIATMIGDMFVDYLKSELRIWYIGIVLVMLKMAHAAEVNKTSATEPTAHTALGPMASVRSEAITR